MQNKIHHVAMGMTAAEIIRRRADSGKTNMGLTAWKGGHVLKRDVGTAKNYLDLAKRIWPPSFLSAELVHCESGGR